MNYHGYSCEFSGTIFKIMILLYKSQLNGNMSLLGLYMFRELRKVIYMHLSKDLKIKVQVSKSVFYNAYIVSMSCLS